jgi:hypothetical protein
MKRIAQIFDNKAYWIFEAPDFPEFAPNIVMMDITGMPEVQEGWEYDPETHTFHGEPSPTPEPTTSELAATQLTIMDALADIYIMLSGLAPTGGE